MCGCRAAREASRPDVQRLSIVQGDGAGERNAGEEGDPDTEGAHAPHCPPSFGG